ncbi:MAG TPA: UDP-N-acetylmuramoyl-tripeptide--D-alanyl-D-alanine ligase [Gammaproteobacteria bacterium]|nr:UDP-N-acetylmuramoyl-tripeptide--D-alanyl-D-alanine ligase [Gammaproteobacteria bacterium]
MISLGLMETAGFLDATLRGNDARYVGVSTDSRNVLPGSLFVAIEGERFDGHDFVDAAAGQGALAALISKARRFPLPTIEVDDTVAALGKLAGHWRSRFKVPLTAITGSNGKTTVKEMLATILERSHEVLATKGNLNNEIGAPLTLCGIDQTHEQIIVELGANHPGEIARLTRMSLPSVGVITVCAPAHLEGFGSVQGVARAKGELFSEMPADACAVINADDAFAPLWAELAGARRKVRFGLHKDADVFGQWQPAGSGGALRIQSPVGRFEARIAFPGKHNGVNALGAAAAAIAVGASAEDIRLGLESARPVSGRLELKRGPGGAAIIDDTYNANPHSLKAGLEVLADQPEQRWLVLGDMAELGSDAARYHEEAGRMARELGVDRLYTVGELSRLAAERFGRHALHFDSQDGLIAALRSELNGNAAVLVKGSRSMGMERVVAALTAKE